MLLASVRVNNVRDPFYRTECIYCFYTFSKLIQTTVQRVGNTSIDYQLHSNFLTTTQHLPIGSDVLRTLNKSQPVSEDRYLNYWYTGQTTI